ncbi:hypothetical protein R3P38DRAFT_3476608 [Favolaschia claudopus]|uniref:Uncharacterized protein n=1 Tax=Favolaschia claudopus TaxID=2862362 RepID=A0AAV9ZB53_9AGAR
MLLATVPCLLPLHPPPTRPFTTAELNTRTMESLNDNDKGDEDDGEKAAGGSLTGRDHLRDLVVLLLFYVPSKPTKPVPYSCYRSVSCLRSPVPHPPPARSTSSSENPSSAFILKLLLALCILGVSSCTSFLSPSSHNGSPQRFLLRPLRLLSPTRPRPSRASVTSRTITRHDHIRISKQRRAAALPATHRSPTRHLTILNRLASPRRSPASIH